jgi:hypothetical protein
LRDAQTESPFFVGNNSLYIRAVGLGKQPDSGRSDRLFRFCITHNTLHMPFCIFTAYPGDSRKGNQQQEEYVQIFQQGESFLKTTKIKDYFDSASLCRTLFRSFLTMIVKNANMQVGKLLLPSGFRYLPSVEK